MMRLETISIGDLESVIELQKDYVVTRSAAGCDFNYEEVISILNNVLSVATHRIKHQNYCVGNCQSNGEKKVARALIDLGYTPYHNVIKKDCKGNFRPLPFDFGIIVNGKELLIEYDGEQHFEPIDFFGGTSKYSETIRYDRIKNDYCLNHNIPLLRIKKGENVKHKLKEFIKKHTA